MSPDAVVVADGAGLILRAQVGNRCADRKVWPPDKLLRVASLSERNRQKDCEASEEAGFTAVMIGYIPL